MTDLAHLQAAMAQALFEGSLDEIEGLVRPGPVPAAEALSVHRDTALGGLVAALRLTFPTVDALVGEAFFDQAALAFIRRSPPAGAWLTGYGAGFAAFLETHASASGLPYLADVARLDAAVDAVGADAPGRDGAAVDLGGALLTLDASLRVLALDYPAAAIRDAIEAGNEAAMAAIDLEPRSHALALWRRPQGAATRPLSAISAAFLQAAIQGGDVEGALASACDLSPLQSEVFAAPFARVAALSEEPAP